jgi:hypothetical protein
MVAGIPGRSGRQLTNKKGWSTSGKITANVGGSNSPQGQVSLQANFAEDAFTYVVGFATQNAVGNGVQARALLIISVEGSSISRVVDVDSGASIAIVGQALNAIVYDVSPDFAEIGTQQYDVFIQCSKGVRGGFSNPPRLTSINPANGIPLYTIGATSTVEIKDITTPATALGGIPVGPGAQLAGAVSVNVAISGFPNVVPDDSVQVQMINNANVIMAYDPRDMQWAPIPPGTQYLQISNHNAFSVTATVTYGIDG